MNIRGPWTLALTLGGALMAQTPPPMPPEPPSVEGAEAKGDVRMELRTMRLPMNKCLWVRNRNGSIKVVAWDKEEVSLSAEIRDSRRRRVTLRTDAVADGLDIEAVVEQPRWTFSFGFVTTPRCEMTLSVPRRLKLHCRTANGHVQVSGLEGFTRCETANGDILVRDLVGEAHVQTVNGDIEARRLKARMQGGTSNGRILLDEVLGGIHLETSNGDIRARGLDGWGEGIQLTNTNGSVEVELGRATGDLSARNVSGNLDIKVPGMQVFEMTRHRAQVKVPGRSQAIQLRTVTGNIRVRQ